MPVMRRLTQLIVIHACGLLYASSAYAYGSLGHEVVGEIAWQNLCEPARVEVALLLGDESLGQASRWPDWIRGEREWAHTRTWHYINVADNGSLEAVLKSNDNNVITAIEWSRGQLADNRLSAEKRAQALKNALIVRNVDPARLQVVGFGEAKPVAGNDTEAGRQMNRRVRVVIIPVEA